MVEQVQRQGHAFAIPRKPQAVVFRAKSCIDFVAFSGNSKCFTFIYVEEKISLAEEVWKFARSFSIAGASASAFITL